MHIALSNLARVQLNSRPLWMELAMYNKTLAKLSAIVRIIQIEDGLQLHHQRSSK